MLQIFQCAKNVRQAILNSREKENAWRFQGTLLDYSDTDIPYELFSLIRWIIQRAQAAATLSRAEELRKQCTIISQILVRECKSQRQVFVPNRRKILLRPIFDQLGAQKAKALMNWHALTGCDTTGHLQGKSKTVCFKEFIESSQPIVSAIAQLREGDKPSDSTIRGCEEYFCRLFSPKGVVIKRCCWVTVVYLPPAERRPGSRETHTYCWCLERTHPSCTFASPRLGTGSISPARCAWSKHLKMGNCWWQVETCSDTGWPCPSITCCKKILPACAHAGVHAKQIT